MPPVQDEKQMLHLPSGVRIATRANETELLENPKAGEILGMHDGHQAFCLEMVKPELDECGCRLRREASPPGAGGVAVEELDLFSIGEALETTVPDQLTGLAFDDRARTQPRLGYAIDMPLEPAVRFSPGEDPACEVAGLWIRADLVGGIQVSFVEGTNHQALRRDRIDGEHRRGGGHGQDAGKVPARPRPCQTGAC
jgi:hypothetical protein